TCPAEHPRAAMFGLHPQMARHAGAWLDLVIAMVLPSEHGAPVWPTPASGRLMPVVHREDQMFRDRVDAGRQLAETLASEAFADPVILALPRGGVPVAAEVAHHLGQPFDVLVVRKVGAPRNPEFGIGAVAEGGIRFSDPLTLRQLGLDMADFEARAEDEEVELARRVDRYRQGRPLPDLTDRDVVLVDDGLATGVTATAALLAARRLGARRVVLAVP